MAALIYSAIMSLDGFVADSSGAFDWAAPDAEVHAFVNDLERPVGTYLYGRRMYDVMSAWETMPTGPEESAVTNDFARIWRSADKVVYSKTLGSPSTTKTRVERDFDPDAVRRLKANSQRDLGIGGPTIAARALSAGLVDECHVFTVPIVVGAGLRAFQDGRAQLELVDERRFRSGVVYLRYRVSS
jgi:dihydrofolate reductase